MELQKDIRRSLEKLLEGESALIHINTRSEGLSLPDHLLESPSTTLRLSYHFRGALELQEEKILAELSFDSLFIQCIIPYTAVWGVSSETALVNMWLEHTPPEVLTMIATEGAKRSKDIIGVQDDKSEGKKTSKRSGKAKGTASVKLASVKKTKPSVATAEDSDASKEEPISESSKESSQKASRPTGHLRRVK